MADSGGEGLIATLPTLQRLALAYAPRTAHDATLALLALDTRLAGIVRNSHEPALAQLRLAWWREQLVADPATWPLGEPLLAALQQWGGQQAALGALVDGWEQLTAPAPLDEAALLGFAAGRGRAFAALALVLGLAGDSEFADERGRAWALADLFGRTANPDERRLAAALLAAQPTAGPLPRALRPLVVLHGMALRQARGRGSSLAKLLTAMRLGLLGR